MSDTPLYLKPLPEDDGIISVTIQRTPRWKESELSGDEWRYSMAVVVEFKDWENGGSDIQTIGGVDFAELSLRLADFLMRNQSYGNQQAVPYRVDEPGDIKVCFQPGCIQRPENVFAIKQEWTWHPNQGHKMDRGEHARPVVRAFCEGHSDRGDCDLEDNDDNYELIAYFPPIGGDEPVELTPDERETLDRTLDRMEGIGGDDE